MKKEDFEALGFSTKENWGNIEKIQWILPFFLSMVEKRLDLIHDCFLVVHCAYEEKGHAPKSYHYQGLAVDFRIENQEKLKSQYNALSDALINLKIDNFCGFGVYPEWHNPGFHFDLRGSRLRWIQKNGIYIYGDEKKIKKEL